MKPITELARGLAHAHREADPDIQQMKPIAELARELAHAHREADPDIQQIWMIEDPEGREVRLLEVSDTVGNVGAIMPFRFTPHPDFPYPSVVILVSPEEKKQLDDGELSLPKIWGPSPKLEPIE